MRVSYLAGQTNSQQIPLPFDFCNCCRMSANAVKEATLPVAAFYFTIEDLASATATSEEVDVQYDVYRQGLGTDVADFAQDIKRLARELAARVSEQAGAGRTQAQEDLLKPSVRLTVTAALDLGTDVPA